MAAPLEGFGFVTMDLAKTSIAEQRAGLWSAEIVISIYGSDLLALLFMRPGADLVELTYNIAFDAGTDSMCSMIDVNYSLVLCQHRQEPGWHEERPRFLGGLRRAWTAPHGDSRAQE